MVPLIFLSLLTDANGNNNNANNAQNPNNAKMITWNDFYYNLLLAGEVQEVVVYSGAERSVTLLKKTLHCPWDLLVFPYNAKIEAETHIQAKP